ncbi:alkaline phosphatase family protein [Algibacillus agarilyticus]|uniref:alkaline phosphatase family protein n=1 Tax=Algibacillus agarilyticus TaxID=2234133 RepID=UPI000DD06F35|nr:nucleotide pyrophosphatase/phosphodiesterase family protein [Algibacillus agarilyticus]
MQKNKQLVVLDVVGLSVSLLGENTPNINRYIAQNEVSPMGEVFPAVTTTAQASMLTGVQPQHHGIVGNGWYERDFAEVMFWKQSNKLVQGDKVWDHLKSADPAFKCSKLFWWYNMYANVDNSITPRPHYPADGRKIIDLYSTPNGLHQSIESEIGQFPFFNFWGPKAGIQSSQWIAKAAMIEFSKNQPNLQLVYLPHLDYCLQKVGPSDPSVAIELQAIDAVVGELIDFYQAAGADVAIVSEYGMNEVSQPIHINRILREAGYITIRDSLTWEMLDPGACKAFAVADHQVAHVYINDASLKQQVKTLLSQTAGIAQVLDADEKQQFNVDHERAGDLIVIAEPDRWFTYYYWLDDKKAPDFASTVDIHRKPGYDPAEMFVDPKLTLPMARVIWRLIQKKLGFRMLMDVIPLQADMIKGSHGRLAQSPEEGALVILPAALMRKNINMPDIADIIKQYYV